MEGDLLLVQPAVSLSSLSADLVAGCLQFLHVVDLCRAGRASRTTRGATDIVCALTLSLCVAQDAPFLDDGGLRNLLRRCPALVEIDIDARRLSGAGAAAIAEAVPGLTGVTLRNGYGWSGIDFLINSAAGAAGLANRSRYSPPSPLSSSPTSDDDTIGSTEVAPTVPGVSFTKSLRGGRDDKEGEEDEEQEQDGSINRSARPQEQEDGGVDRRARSCAGAGAGPTTMPAAGVTLLSRRRRRQKRRRQQQKQQLQQRQQQQQLEQPQWQWQQHQQQLRELLVSSAVGCASTRLPSPLASLSPTPPLPSSVVGGVKHSEGTRFPAAATAAAATTAAALAPKALATAAASTTTATITATSPGRHRWQENIATGGKPEPPSLTPCAPRGAPQREKPPLALRSLTLCGFGPSVGLGNPTPEHFEEWSRLAETCAPVLRCLTLTNVSAGQLPICALTPFFKYPHIRSSAAATARGFQVNAVNCAGPSLAGGSGAAIDAGRMCYGGDVGGGGDAGSSSVGGARGVGVGGGVDGDGYSREGGGNGGAISEPAEESHDGLVELSLATVSSKLAATVLRGEKRPIPLCFRSEGGAAFPGGPRPPLTGLRRLSLVVDDITDALCLAISEGCPNIREVSLRQKRGQPTAFSDDGPMALARCQQLTSLGINSGHQRLKGCGNLGLVFMVAKLARLKQLSLCGLSRATDLTVAAILDHPERDLRQLSLEGCEQLTGEVFFQPLVDTAQSFRRLTAMFSLTSISLARSKAVTPEAIKALSRACGPCLESLDLSYCCVTDEVLTSVLALPGLQDLVLCKCPFTNEGLIAACEAITGDSDSEPVDTPLRPPRDDDDASIHGDSQQQSRQQLPLSLKSTSVPTPTRQHHQNQQYQQHQQHRQDEEEPEEGGETNARKKLTQPPAGGGSSGKTPHPRKQRVQSAAGNLNAAARCQRAPLPPSESPPPPQHATPQATPHSLPQQSKQRLRKLSLSGCRGVQGSGVIALLRSGRLGSHTRAADVTGLSALEDGHVRALLEGMPRLQELRLSGCGLLTRSTLVSIIRSACGKATLSVLDLRCCHRMQPARLTLLKPPSLPALLWLAWWGNDPEAEKMAALARGGNCWVVPGSA